MVENTRIANKRDMEYKMKTGVRMQTHLDRIDKEFTVVKNEIKSKLSQHDSKFSELDEQ